MSGAVAFQSQVMAKLPVLDWYQVFFEPLGYV